MQIVRLSLTCCVAALIPLLCHEVPDPLHAKGAFESACLNQTSEADGLTSCLQRYPNVCVSCSAGVLVAGAPVISLLQQVNHKLRLPGIFHRSASAREPHEPTPRRTSHERYSTPAALGGTATLPTSQLPLADSSIGETAHTKAAQVDKPCGLGPSWRMGCMRHRTLHSSSRPWCSTTG